MNNCWPINPVSTKSGEDSAPPASRLRPPELPTLGVMERSSTAMKNLTEQIPLSLLPRSGKVFYSGRNAFTTQSDLYVLGVNPGGAPTAHDTETVGSHTDDVLNVYPADWSAYRDESWVGAVPGTYGMAPRVLHLFAKLGVSPGSVPCS